jgi:hypothetical protein
VPQGWELVSFSFQIPLRLVRAEFVAKISYEQPHFPKKVSAYLPIQPPLAKEAISRVRFTPVSGYGLRLRSRNEGVLLNSAESVVVRPVDRELILVGVVKGRPSDGRE